MKLTGKISKPFWASDYIQDDALDIDHQYHQTINTL